MTDNFKTLNSKKEIKIVVDEDHGIKEFGSDTFENLITHFVECDYQDKKKDLEDSIKDKDIIKLKNVLHKIKTLTMYMNCVDLAQLCKEIEYFTQKGHENHETAFSMVPEFLSYFAKLYDEAYKLFRLKYSQIIEEVSVDKEKSNYKEDKYEEKRSPKGASKETSNFLLGKSSSEFSLIVDQIPSAQEFNAISIPAKPSSYSKENLLDFNSKIILKIIKKYFRGSWK
jgi:HPt (histidine-containing phosphotransfer) domain-containing protein